MEDFPKIEYLDQSKFSCVFCLSSGVRDLRLHGDSDSDSSGKKSPLQVTLRNISRYLQICPPELSSSSSWYFCSKCSKLAVEFNDLFHLGEEIKLRLNWCLQIFQDVMTTQNLENENQSEAENDYYGDLEHFRAAIKGRTKEISSVPRVALFKIQIPEKPLLDGSPTDAVEFLESDEDIEIQSPAGIEIGIQMECDDTSECSDMEASHSGSQNSSKAEASPKTLQQGPRCPYCRAEFQGRDVEMSLGLHIVQYHCDTLFPNCKLDSVTSSEFKIITGELLFKDLICEPRKCAFCNKKFKDHKETKRTVYASQIKRHLIDAHFNEMKERLREIQNTPNISNQLRECNPIGEICECGVYLPTFGARTSHVKWHCPLVGKEKQLPPPKIHGKAKVSHPDFISGYISISSSSSSSKLKCKSCHVSFANRHSALRHWKYYCKKGKKLAIPKLGTLTCQYCSFEYANRAHGAGSKNMKRHLVRMHPHHFFPHESNDNESSRSQSQDIDSILQRVLFPQFSLKDGNGSGMSCSLCGVKYKRSYDQSLKMHLINRHKPQLRDSLKTILEDADGTLKEKLRRKLIAPKANMNSTEATEMKMEAEYIVPNDFDPLTM